MLLCFIISFINLFANNYLFKKKVLQLLIIYIFFILIQLIILFISKHRIFIDFPNVFRLYFYFIILFSVLLPCILKYQKLFFIKINKITKPIFNYYIDLLLFLSILLLDFEVFFFVGIQSLYFLIPIYIFILKDKQNKKRKIAFYTLLILFVIGTCFFIYNLYWLNRLTNWNYYFKLLFFQ